MSDRSQDPAHTVYSVRLLTFMLMALQEGDCTLMSSYLQQLVQIVPYVVVDQGRVKNLEICVVDILKHQTGCPGLRVPDYIQELDDVCAPADVLQDFDLSLDLRMVEVNIACFVAGHSRYTADMSYLLFFDRFEYFDYTFLVVHNVNALENLAVLAPANFPDNLVVVLIPAVST